MYITIKCSLSVQLNILQEPFMTQRHRKMGDNAPIARYYFHEDDCLRELTMIAVPLHLTNNGEEDVAQQQEIRSPTSS